MGSRINPVPLSGRDHTKETDRPDDSARKIQVFVKKRLADFGAEHSGLVAHGDEGVLAGIAFRAALVFGCIQILRSRTD
jgi:hypothetical protein